MRETVYVSDERLREQREYARRVKALKDRPESYHIVTLGCQMNVRDSQTVAGMLEEMGMAREDVREKAGLILYNTCCVRENAENKALGNVIWLKELKREDPGLVVCVGGCMAQEKGMAERIKKECPFVDVVFGTHNMYKLPEYLYRALTERAGVSEVWDVAGEVAEGLPVLRDDPHFAFVNVMYGCDNFCSYCIVPYVRGRERSRSADDVVRECDELAAKGVREVMLLGQNVNSYGGGGRNFADLLRRVDGCGIARIRFMTSHPKDLSDELIGCFGTLRHLMPALHLPVQAGNDEVLARMNRRYTREKYLSLVEKLRAACPGIGLSTDIIVGFPGETEEQFRDTLSLVREVRYDSAYTFVFSPRTGTAAASMPDPVTAEEKSERIQRLIALQQDITQQILLSRVGMRETLLTEGKSARREGFSCGRTERGMMVNFPGVVPAGEFVGVTVTSAGRNTLRGEMAP